MKTFPYVLLGLVFSTILVYPHMLNKTVYLFIFKGEERINEAFIYVRNEEGTNVSYFVVSSADCVYRNNTKKKRGEKLILRGYRCSPGLIFRRNRLVDTSQDGWFGKERFKIEPISYKHTLGSYPVIWEDREEQKNWESVLKKKIKQGCGGHTS